MILLTDERHLALFLAGTIAKDPHHRESPIPLEQGSGFVEWSCGVEITTKVINDSVFAIMILIESGILLKKPC